MIKEIKLKSCFSALYLIYIGIFMVNLLTFTSCSNKGNVKSNDNRDIILNIWGGESLIGESELEKDQSEWLLTTLLQEYEQQNKNLKINYTYIEDESTMYQILKRNISSEEEVPDIVILENGYAFAELSETFLALDEYMTKEDLESNLYWDTAKGKDGKIYGYPTGGMQIAFLAYNKELAEQLNLDLENNPPKYYKDFLELIDSVKNNSDILPIISADYNYNSLYSLVLSKWWVQQKGYDTVSGLMDGRHGLQEDQAFLESLEIGQDFYSKGYINLDYATNTTAIQDFTEFGALFYPTQNSELSLLYKTMGDKLGVMEIPDYAEDTMEPSLNFGSCNQCFSIINSTIYKEECYQLLNWLNNRENSIKMYYNYRTLPIRSDVTFQDVGYIEENIYRKIYNLKDKAKLSVLTFFDKEIQQMYYRYGVQTIMNQMESSEFAKLLDEKIQSRKRVY